VLLEDLLVLAENEWSGSWRWDARFDRVHQLIIVISSRYQV
jgi:hypothetical protein